VLDSGVQRKDRLVDEDIGVLRTPPGLFTFSFNNFAQRIGPKGGGEPSILLRLGQIDEPLDATLLSPAFATHFITNFSPKYVVIHIFTLLDCHIGNNPRELFLFLLCPMSWNVDSQYAEVARV
jgi:hypothetical protein